ncbi:MAG: large conductance mechanosensitive channel protein MscL [Aquabacterium sp.]|uniref:large conductance mechanosensitive channel protein MscL n=1 Tax=Aquabacterium sp. TaxID=1872578 RepID=UPI003BB0D1D5
MHFWRDFRKFVTRGNLVDLAVGFTVGAAFTTIARSLVDDIIMPPVGLLMGRTDFKDFFVVLREGPSAAGPYLTLAQAKAAGAVTLNYGMFINAMLAHHVGGPGDVHRESADEPGGGADGCAFPGATATTGRAFR